MVTKVKGTTGVDRIESSAIISNPTFDGTGTFSSGIYLGGTAAANLLDDYEEGTWTPEITNPNDDVTATYSWREGFYRKIGSFVWCYGAFSLSSYSVTSTTTAFEIDGLPFACIDLLPSSSLDGGGYVPYWGNLATTWSYMSASSVNGTSTARLWGIQTAAATCPQVRCLDFDGDSSLRFNLTYLTND